MKKIIFFGGLMCLAFTAVSKPSISFTSTFTTDEISSNYGEDENEVTITLEEESKVSIKIYDLQGNLVKTIKNNESIKAGEHHFYISLKDHRIKKGSYFRKISVNGKVRKVKMVTIY